MIYDCFIFNDEIELLKLRLNFLNDIVDYFVIVESNFTFTNLPKPLHFNNNSDVFSEYSDKIIHLVVQSNISQNAWDNEFYQREYIKQGLKNCTEEDIIIISDVDEIPNLYEIIPFFESDKIHSLRMYFSYYFLNTITKINWQMAIIGKYKSINKIYLGNRSEFVKNVTPLTFKHHSSYKQGWHLSYLFGFNYELYANKIKSFSHTEFNNTDIVDPDRIYNIIQMGNDLYNRKELYFWPKKPELIFTNKFLKSIKMTKMEHYIFPKPKYKNKFVKYIKMLMNYYSHFNI